MTMVVWRQWRWTRPPPPQQPQQLRELSNNKNDTISFLGSKNTGPTGTYYAVLPSIYLFSWLLTTRFKTLIFFSWQYSYFYVCRLEDLVAHEDIISIITNLIDSDQLPHLLLYGPPGTGTLVLMRLCVSLFSISLNLRSFVFIFIPLFLELFFLFYR